MSAFVSEAKDTGGGSAEIRRVPLRLGVLGSHLTPYFSPLYRHLARRVDAFEVGYFRQIDPGQDKPMFDPGFGKAFSWDIDLRSGYEFTSFDLEEAPFKYPAKDLARLVRNVHAWAKRFRPDVVMVPGWVLPYVLCAQTLRAAGVKLILRPEGRVPRGPALVRGLARDVWCRAMVRSARAAAIVGTASRDELMRLGMKPEQMVFSPYVIDTDLLGARLAEVRGRREAIRSRLGLAAHDCAYLFVGKLAGYKRPRQLLEAFVQLSRRVDHARLILVGDGELRSELVARAEEAGVSQQVTFAGFVNQAELPEYYAAADVFVLPSIETWGLVANEALLAGLPLAISVDAGCARDLVADGVTGRRLYVERPGQVVEALEQLADPAVREVIRPAVERLAQRYTVEAAADGIVEAAQLAATC